MKKAKLQYMRSCGHGFLDPDKPIDEAIQKTNRHLYPSREVYPSREADDDEASLDDPAVQAAVARAMAGRVLEAVVRDMRDGLRWRMEMTTSRVASAGCAFRPRTAAGELIAPGEGGRPEDWPTGFGAPSYVTGAVAYAGDGRPPDPWERPSRWASALDWSAAPPEAAPARRSPAAAYIGAAAAENASPRRAFQSEKAEVRAAGAPCGIPTDSRDIFDSSVPERTFGRSPSGRRGTPRSLQTGRSRETAETWIRRAAREF